MTTQPTPTTLTPPAPVRIVQADERVVALDVRPPATMEARVWSLYRAFGAVVLLALLHIAGTVLFLFGDATLPTLLVMVVPAWAAVGVAIFAWIKPRGYLVRYRLDQQALTIDYGDAAFTYATDNIADIRTQANHRGVHVLVELHDGSVENTTQSGLNAESAGFIVLMLRRVLQRALREG